MSHRIKAIGKIKNAFKDIRLQNGLTIRQCIAVDNHMDMDSPEFADYKDFEDWADIPDEQVEKIGTHHVLTYSGKEGVLFYLPASMRYILENYSGFFDSSPEVNDVHALTMICLESEETVSLLNKEQKEAVKDFLKALIAMPFDTDNEEKILSVYS